MNQAYANALKRKKELEKELHEVNMFLAMHKRFAGVDSTRVKRKPIPKPTKSTKEFGRPDEFARIMEGILRKEGRPMTRGELADAVERAGHQIPSGDKPRYLGTIMWRLKRRFENRGEGYWLKGVSLPKTADDHLELALGR